jgi:hypothetical protein
MEIITYFKEMWQFASQGQTQGIWFWAASYWLVIVLYSLVVQIRTRFWPFTQGELVKLGVEKFGASDWDKTNEEYVSKTLYKYNISGVDYNGTRVSPWILVASYNLRFVLEKQMSSIQRLPGGKVKVFYNPKNPNKSYLIVPGYIGINITLLISVLPLILYYFKYYG